MIGAVRQARLPEKRLTEVRVYPTLSEALPEWIDREALAGEIRQSTANIYRSRLATWLYPHPLGDGRLLGDVADGQPGDAGDARRGRPADPLAGIIEGVRNHARNA